MYAHVISPDDVPRADRVRPEALSPTLAVLSAMVHLDDGVLRASTLALKPLQDETQFQLYANMLCDTRPGADVIVEATLAIDPQLEERSRGIFTRARREAREEALEEGREALRHALRSILSGRQLTIPSDLEARLAAADMARLEAWLVAASTAEPGDDVFANE